MLCLYPRCLKSLGEKVHYGMHPECFAEWFHVEENAEFMGLQNISTSSSSGRDFTPQNNSFFQGKFKKYSAELQGEEYILKMRQAQAPELPDVEYLCNQIAQVCYIDVAAPFHLIELNGERVFVVKNFVRTETGEELQHIYQFRTDNQHTCEDLISVIMEKTQQPANVATFIRMLLLDALIMNHDRHGRNLGFIARQGSYYLSPIYDNVSYLSLEMDKMLTMDFDLRGKIATKASHYPNMFDYAVELIRLGYQEEVQRFYQHLKSMGRTIITRLIDRSFCSGLMKEAMKKVINKRFEELENALST